MSEESDALVLVLSEETGELRIVHRGAISEALRTGELEARIVQWLATPRAEATRSPKETRADPGESMRVRAAPIGGRRPGALVDRAVARRGRRGRAPRAQESRS